MQVRGRDDLPVRRWPRGSPYTDGSGLSDASPRPDPV